MSLTVMAHQGGWDEALLVAVPLLVLAAMVWNAKRRATRQAQARGDLGDGPRAGADYSTPMSAPSDARSPGRSS